MLASIVKQYKKGGLLAPLVLVGIGNISFKLMGSLRVRDQMFSAALPSDEMQAPGGGKNLDDFLVNQLVPYIDSNYKKSSKSLFTRAFIWWILFPICIAKPNR